MSVQCPRCKSANIQRTAPGALIDSYRSRDCSGTFELVSPTVKQVAIIAIFTALTGGLDGGALGTGIASLFGPSSS